MTIKDIFTLPEAEKLWGFSRGYLQRIIERHPERFTLNVDIRKSSRTWLITYDCMVKIYGNKK